MVIEMSNNNIKTNKCASPLNKNFYNINNGTRETRTTDPLGNISVQTVDGRGNITQVQRFGKDENSTP